MSSPARSHIDPAEASTSWKRWALLGVVALLLGVALLNWQTVEFNLLFINTSAPLILLLLGVALIGAAIGYLAPIVSRHRKND